MMRVLTLLGIVSGAVVVFYALILSLVFGIFFLETRAAAKTEAAALMYLDRCRRAPEGINTKRTAPATADHR